MQVSLHKTVDVLWKLEKQQRFEGQGDLQMNDRMDIRRLAVQESLSLLLQCFPVSMRR